MSFKSISLILALTLVAATPVVAQPKHTEHHEPFQQMQKKLDEAEKAPDGNQRRKLMQEHMAMMHEEMQAMHGMMNQQGMMSGPMEQRMQRMQEHMSDMQMMMEQMMGQQQMMMEMENSGDTE